MDVGAADDGHMQYARQLYVVHEGALARQQLKILKPFQRLARVSQSCASLGTGFEPNKIR